MQVPKFEELIDGEGYRMLSNPNMRNAKEAGTLFHKMSRNIEILISRYGAWTLAKTTLSPKACFAELLIGRNMSVLRVEA